MAANKEGDMPNTTPTTSTPTTDVLMATLAVLFARGCCLGRHYSVGYTHQATGETRLEVLDLQGTPFFTTTPDELFEAALLFVGLEEALPMGVGEGVVPQYSPEHPCYPERS